MRTQIHFRVEMPATFVRALTDLKHRRSFHVFTVLHYVLGQQLDGISFYDIYRVILPEAHTDRFTSNCAKCHMCAQHLLTCLLCHHML